MKKAITFLVLLIFCFAIQGYCQVNDSLKTQQDSLKTTQPTTPPAQQNTQPQSSGSEESFFKKLDFGFGSTVWFNATGTHIEISPMIGYRLTKRITTGIGYRLIYLHVKSINNDQYAYGPNFVASMYLTRRIYLWSEYEILHNKYYAVGSNNHLAKADATTNSLFGGIGYVRSVGKRGRGGLSFQILYNFLYDEDDEANTYFSPVTYRVGYFF